MTSLNKAEVVAEDKAVLGDGSRESRSDANGTWDLQARQLVISTHLTFCHTNIRPAEGSFGVRSCSGADISHACLIQQIRKDRVRVGERENSESGIAGAWKPGNIAGRIQSIPRKCDCLIVVSEEEASSELTIWAKDVVKVT